MDLIKLLDIINKDEINMYEAILTFLNKRLQYLYDNEPYDDNESVYEKWEDKVDDLEEIIKDVELLIAKDSNISYDKVRIDIKVYQRMYGGLKRI